MKTRQNQRQRKKSRGKQSNARMGSVDSIIEKIHHEEDKMDVACVNRLDTLYKTLLDQAEATGRFEKIGIKDQTKAVEYCIDRAETFLDAHYEEMNRDEREGDDYIGKEVVEEKETPKEVSASLLSFAL